MLPNHIIDVEAGTYDGTFCTGDLTAKNFRTRLPFR
jgi:hypothetical protein